MGRYAAPLMRSHRTTAMLHRTLIVLTLAIIAGCGGSSVPEAPLQPIENVTGPVFEDVTDAVGIHFDMTSPSTVLDEIVDIVGDISGNGAAAGDYDGDGDLDLYLLGHLGQPNKLYRNELMETGEATFTDVTPSVLADLGLGRVAHFVDLDADGDKDLVLVNDDDGTEDAMASKVFRNDGGAFTDVTAGSGFRPVGIIKGGCSVADYDGDGLLDIFVSNWGGFTRQWFEPDRWYGPNRLFRNKGGFVFEDVTGVLALEEDTYSSAFTDFDGDHRADLYIAVDHTSDQFYLNTPAGFSIETEAVGTTHGGNDMGIAAADFDDDGDLDLFTTNITDPDGIWGTGGGGNVLYVDNREGPGLPAFVDEAEDRGVRETGWSWGTQWVDVENDGDLDLMIVTGFDTFVGKLTPSSKILATPSYLFLNDGSGQFTRHRDDVLDVPDDSRTLISFDYDRDGDMDMLVTNINGPVRLLRNVAGRGNWLGVALGPDHKAIGAAVYATIGGVTKRRDVLAGGSYLAGTPTEVQFGLNVSPRVDRLRIVWSDGVETTLEDVSVNQWLRLTR